MHNKVEFKKITDKEIKAITLILIEYINATDIKTNDFYRLTVGFVLYDVMHKKLKKLLDLQQNKYSFSLPIHYVSSLYIALEQTRYDDYFSRHVVRKFQTIIQNYFLNRM